MLVLVNTAIMIEAGHGFSIFDQAAQAVNQATDVANSTVQPSSQFTDNLALTTTASLAATFGSGAVVLTAAAVWVYKFARNLTQRHTSSPRAAADSATKAAIRALDEMELAARAGAKAARATSTALRDDVKTTRTGKKRGRPRKDAPASSKRGPGRPRKRPSV